jgi:pyridinium-3,5-biscarboxylic acid mononucleotide synthase
MAHGAQDNGNTRQDRHSMPAGPIARPDLTRESRKGIPEVILAQSKTATQVIAISRHFLESNGRALISRLTDAMADEVIAALPETVPLRYDLAHALRLTVPTYRQPLTGGHVGVITAGTSDVPAAEEARFIAEAMGCRVSTIYDVGVAGVHRLFEPLNDLIAAHVDAIVVAAGMDGALPSLVAGLVPVPVIGLPTAVGYGMGGQGQAALLSMLQSCAPGLVVVNIDNGIGAGASAALIANRAAEARRQPPPSETASGASAVDAVQAPDL